MAIDINKSELALDAELKKKQAQEKKQNQDNENQKLVYVIVLRFVIEELRAENFWIITQQEMLEKEQQDKLEAHLKEKALLIKVREKSEEKIEELVPDDEALQALLSQYIEELLKNFQQSKQIYLSFRRQQQKSFSRDLQKSGVSPERAEELFARLFSLLDSWYSRRAQNGFSQDGGFTSPAENPDFIPDRPPGFNPAYIPNLSPATRSEEVIDHSPAINSAYRSSEDLPVAYPVMQIDPNIVYAGTARYIDERYELARGLGEFFRQEQETYTAPTWEERMCCIYTARQDGFQRENFEQRNIQARDTYDTRCQMHQELSHLTLRQNSPFSTTPRYVPPIKKNKES